uniref:Uncharacterized protein n=1 Tax=viral metagenome TaxID=1070528 RepID=A0A6C0BXV1_9ZZZZ
MAKMSKKFFGLSVFCWVLIIIVFLFVTGIVRVGFVFAENFESGSGSGSGDPIAPGNSKCKKNKYNESQCNKRKEKSCSWTIDKYTGSGKCMCCKPDH